MRNHDIFIVLFPHTTIVVKISYACSAYDQVLDNNCRQYILYEGWNICICFVNNYWLYPLNVIPDNYGFSIFVYSEGLSTIYNKDILR